jgi:hypothetical protein
MLSPSRFCCCADALEIEAFYVAPPQNERNGVLTPHLLFGSGGTRNSASKEIPDKKFRQIPAQIPKGNLKKAPPAGTMPLLS